MYWYNKGISLYVLERYEESILYYDTAIKLNPKLSGAWHNKGGSLEKLGRDGEAEQCFAKARELEDS